MRSRLAGVLLLLAGCELTGEYWQPGNRPAVPPPNSQQAANYIWNRLDHGDFHFPIHWYEGPCLQTGEAGCVGGVYYNRRVYLVKRSEYPHQSALTHELLHIHLALTYRDLDGDHTRVDWFLVDPLNTELRRAGY